MNQVNSLQRLVSQNQGEQDLALGAGTISTTKQGGGAGVAVVLETATLLESVNPIVQFDIDNTGGGATDQTLRIGSVLGEADTYLYWGQTPSAADDPVITDQFGVGCKAVQGFSDLVKSKAVVVTEIKVEMSSNDIQLNQNFKYRKLNYDGTINEIKANIGWTQQKSDYAQNIRAMEAAFVLDSQYFLEYVVKANKELTLFLELGASNSVETFKSMPKVKG